MDQCRLHYFIHHRQPKYPSMLPSPVVTGCVIDFGGSESIGAPWHQREEVAFACLWPAVQRFPSLRRLAIVLGSNQVKALADIHPELFQPGLGRPLDVFRLFSWELEYKHHVELNPTSLKPTGVFIRARVNPLPVYSTILINNYSSNMERELRSCQTSENRVLTCLNRTRNLHASVSCVSAS